MTPHFVFVKSMRRGTLVILFASLIVLSIGFQVWYDQLGDGITGLYTSSPENSRKRGVYVCSLAAEPSHLKIEDHDIIISKAWIEHNFTPAHHNPFSPYTKILPGCRLCVTLFDGDDEWEQFKNNWEEPEFIMSLDSARIFPFGFVKATGFDPSRFTGSNCEFSIRTPNLLIYDLDAVPQSLTAYILKCGERLEPIAVTFQRFN